MIGAEALAEAVRRRLPAKIVELNLRALELGSTLEPASGSPVAGRRC